MTWNRVRVGIEERFHVPSNTSKRAALWIGGHAALALPLQSVGRLRSYRGRVGPFEARVTCVGRPKRFLGLLERIYDTIELLDDPSRPWPLWSSRAAGRLPGDLIAVDVHRWFTPRFRRAGWRIIPDTVRWVGELAHVPPERPSRSLRSDLNKLGRSGFELEVASRRADWDAFYQEMVLPHGAARFGDQVWVPTPRLMEELAAAGSLLFVRDGAERIAGIAIVPARDRLWAAVLGVRDGDRRLLSGGALTAAYAFTVDRARSLGLRWVDFGRTTPFANDGIQHFKRKWGLVPMPDPLAHRVALRVRPGHAEDRRVSGRIALFEETDGGIRTVEI